MLVSIYLPYRIYLYFHFFPYRNPFLFFHKVFHPIIIFKPFLYKCLPIWHLTFMMPCGAPFCKLAIVAFYLSIFSFMSTITTFILSKDCYIALIIMLHPISLRDSSIGYCETTNTRKMLTIIVINLSHLLLMFNTQLIAQVLLAPKRTKPFKNFK